VPVKVQPAISDRQLEHVAQRLKAMSSPLRLRILHAIEDRELTVNEILAVVRTTQANVSKHLTVLRHAGLVRSRRDGVSVYYSVSDPIVLGICHTVCDSILRQLGDAAAALAAPRPRRRRIAAARR
jgi:DNA-binding transcriptional ArsR family regulator